MLEWLQVTQLYILLVRLEKLDFELAIFGTIGTKQHNKQNTVSRNFII